MHVLTRLAGFMQMRKPFRFDVLGSTTDNPSSSSFSFVGVSFGAVPVFGERRYIAVAVAGTTSSGTGTITSVTIGGVSATQVHQPTATGTPRAVFIAEVPTGTSGDVDVVASTSIGQFGLVVARIINPGNPLGFDTADASHSSGVVTLSLDIPQGGAAMAACASQNASTTTWVGLSEQYDVDENSGEFMTGAAGGAPGVPTTVTATNADTTPDQYRGIAVSWGP